MARRRKPGPRTKSGRRSRAHKTNPELRDLSTPENQAKLLAAVNGSHDPVLSATVAGILFAHDAITREQLGAVLRYERIRSLVYGRPWLQPCLLGKDGRTGQPPSDGDLERVKVALARLEKKLSLEQRLAIGRLALGEPPMWFLAERLELRQLPEEARDKAALLSALEALSRPTKKDAALVTPS